ncbi:hypothetical protein [Clostridium tagluense]|uniref:Uncharacterized protein n=1 Tax=Clostridium tagluense TaxID=360422 RepID=A0A401UUN7_9CLOT|nr:hypothetical protein [Clostridium tagluense]GCD13158.1 hypothetical protein Ctaglu_47810 [Clostridium tagluense]
MSKGIEEIVNDNKSNESVKINYKKAYDSYSKYKIDLEFIKYEKIKLNDIIQSKTIEINYTCVYATFISIIIAMAISSLIAISTDKVKPSYFITLIITYAIFILVGTILYEINKKRYLKEIFYAEICLKALEKLE